MTDTNTIPPADTASEPAQFPVPLTGWARLSDRTLVRVSGPGTDAFLQGQFTQHLPDVTRTHAPLAAAATPKGRAYCLTRLARDGEDVLLVLPNALLEATLTRLDKYLRLFRGTSMSAVSGSAVWGLLGEAPARRLAAAAVDELRSPGDALPLDTGLLIRVPDDDRGIARFELWQTTSTPPDTGDFPQLGVADWLGRDIAAGIPCLDEHGLEAWVPQMLNWHHLGGIHFRKGCYTGQEVIARMHFLGQLKKSLYRFSCPGQVPPGTSILAGDQTVGELVTQVRYQDGHSELLAVVRHDAAPAALTAAGLSLTQLPLPYPVPEQQADAEPDT